MSEVKLWHRGDGSVYLNRGPINPVTDPLAALAMANNGERSVEHHLKRIENTRASRYWVPSDLTVDQVRDQAEERVRSNIATQDMDKAKLLFDLVELSHVSEITPPATKQE